MATSATEILYGGTSMARPTPMTLKELKKEVDKAMKAGLGDKYVVLSGDDEGNDYHMVWYDFTTDEDMVRDCFESACTASIGEIDPKDCIILG